MTIVFKTFSVPTKTQSGRFILPEEVIEDRFQKAASFRDR